MMASKQNIMVFSLLVVVLLISVEQYCEALASKAVYVIENLGSKNCLSAGGVTRDSNKTNITLFKHGHALSKPCSDVSSLNTADFSQEWMARVQKENSRKFAYQIQLAMLNTLYYDTNLTAELRGEFITYFPDKLNLRGHHSPEANTQSENFVIVDAETESCLTDSLSENRIQFVTCNDSDNFQKWNFTLVNEKVILPDMFKNASTPFH